MAAKAEALGVTVRSLRNWRRLDPQRPPRPAGRPASPAQAVAAALEAVRAELDRQGWKAGEQPVWRALGGRFSLWTVRRVLRQLKAERRARARAHREAARKSVRVLARDALWSIDATHLGRDAGGRAVQGEVVREVASTRTIGLSVGPKACAVDVIRLLQHTAAECGGLPLVLVSDNDGSYTAHEIERWLHEHRVVHLRNEPRTPQHNATAEHGIGELIADCAVRETPGPLTGSDAMAALLSSVLRLDHARVRATRGWRTASQADRETPSWSVQVTRERFYAAACCARRKAVLNSTNGRARRRAEREATLLTLEGFRLIEWNRGDAARTDASAEDVS